MNYFITATDTDAGKTYVTALLTRAARKAGWKNVAMKPIASGSRQDSETLQSAANHELTLEEITPVYYKAPLVPLEAAPLEGKVFSLEQVLPTFQGLQKKYSSMFVEGVGGWLVPLSPTLMLADLARAIGFPIILVVRNRLGAINHTLLTLESIKLHGFTCAGIILNHHPADQDDLAIQGNRRFFKDLARILHTHRDEEVAKADGARQATVLEQSCMRTYRSSQNRRLTQHPWAFPASTVDGCEISGLAQREQLSFFLEVHPHQKEIALPF